MLLRVSTCTYMYMTLCARSAGLPDSQMPKICTGSKIECVIDGFIVSLVYGRLYKAPSALDRLSTAQHFPLPHQAKRLSVRELIRRTSTNK